MGVLFNDLLVIKGTDTLVSDEDTDTSSSDVDSKTVYNNKVIFSL